MVVFFYFVFESYSCITVCDMLFQNDHFAWQSSFSRLIRIRTIFNTRFASFLIKFASEVEKWHRNLNTIQFNRTGFHFFWFCSLGFLFPVPPPLWYSLRLPFECVQRTEIVVGFVKWAKTNKSVQWKMNFASHNELLIMNGKRKRWIWMEAPERWIENFAFIACKLWNFQINLVLRGLFYAYYTFFYGIHIFFSFHLTFWLSLKSME